jgi:hypothetical protein
MFLYSLPDSGRHCTDYGAQGINRCPETGSLYYFHNALLFDRLPCGCLVLIKPSFIPTIDLKFPTGNQLPPDVHIEK